jgi:protein-S-isoprenylcysteine O-methyltransferase Ste14
MNLWIAKGVVLAGSIAMIVIRAPYGSRSSRVKVAKSYKGAKELILLVVAWIGFFIPLVWVFSSALSFADYPLRVGPFIVGIACLVAGLWLLHRSHADLGTNWSITLEIREDHRLITDGVYRSVRHPMYTAFFLHSVGQALVLPNWVAGPSYLIAFAILFALRVHTEERMMIETFGDAYLAYMAKTKRLVPGIW